MVRKKRLPKRRALVQILKLGTLCLIVGLACIAIFQGIQPNSGKKMAEGHKVFQMQGQFQGILDASSLIKPKQDGLELSDVQKMTAGAIVDVSGLPQENLDSLFYSLEISNEVQRRILGCSYQENETISLGELRYLRVLYLGFDGETHVGELIVNQSIAKDILEIMSELYRQSYPIERMVLVDAYGADDESSMSDNNTSAFNYREVAGTSTLSKHALGLAIDINPRYNPYVKQGEGGELLVSPANGAEYADRSREFPHKIAKGDICLRLFQEHGFSWGGDWNYSKDYQHFEK